MLFAALVCISLLHAVLSLERHAIFDQKKGVTSVYYSIVKNIPEHNHIQCIRICLEFEKCRAAIVSEGDGIDLCRLLLGDEIANMTYDVEENGQTVWLKRYTENNTITTEQETKGSPGQPVSSIGGEFIGNIRIGLLSSYYDLPGKISVFPQDIFNL